MSESGSATEARLVQRKKALSSIEVTELGIVMDVRVSQFAKALVPITVIELGMFTWPITSGVIIQLGVGGSVGGGGEHPPL